MQIRDALPVCTLFCARASIPDTLNTKPILLRFARRIWVAVFAFAAIAFMAYVIGEQHAVIAAIQLRRPWLLVLAAISHGAFWMVAVAFWRYTVQVTTHRTLPMKESLRQLALVAVGKYIPGKVSGFLARGAALKESETTTRGVFAATFVEQWTMLMSAALVGGVLLLLIRPNGMLIALGVTSISIAVYGNHFFRFGNVAFQRLLAMISGSIEARQSTPLRYRQYLALVLAHSLMWVLIGTVLASICFAFSPQPFSINLYGALLLANTVGIVVGFVALFAPGGLGVREAVTTAVLLPYLPVEQAAILSIAFRAWTSGVDVLIAAGLVWQTTRTAARA